MGRRSAKPQKHTEYYELVGCAADASADEIKKAYRKTALRLHPDRGGDREAFQKMKSAYDVISDPSKRKLYDRYGPDVIKMMEGETPTSMAFMLNLRKRDRLFLVAIISLVSLLLLLFPILLSIRWDALEGGSDSRPYSWAVPFIPLWFLQLLAASAFAEQVRQPPLDASNPDVDAEARATWNSNERALRYLRGVFFTSLALMVVWQIFLALRLDGTVTWSWYLVMLPIILYMALTVALALVASPEAFRAVDPAAADLEASDRAAALPLGAVLRRPAFWAFALYRTRWSVALLVTAVVTAFVAEENEQGNDVSFYVAAAPLLIVAAGALALRVLVSALRPAPASTDQRQQQEQQQQQQQQQQQGENKQPGVLGAMISWACSYGFLLIVTCTAASKLSDVDAFSAFAIFSPVFFVVGCVCCLCSLTALTVTAEDLEASEEELRRQNGQQQQQQQEQGGRDGDDGEQQQAQQSMEQQSDAAAAGNYGTSGDTVVLNLT